MRRAASRENFDAYDMRRKRSSMKNRHFGRPCPQKSLRRPRNL
jgi:hypothetical protein